MRLIAGEMQQLVERAEAGFAAEIYESEARPFSASWHTERARLVAPAICLPAPRIPQPRLFQNYTFSPRQCRSAFNLSRNELDSIVSPSALRDGLVTIRRQLMTPTWWLGLFFRISFSSWAGRYEICIWIWLTPRRRNLECQRENLNGRERILIISFMRECWCRFPKVDALKQARLSYSNLHRAIWKCQLVNS